MLLVAPATVFLACGMMAYMASTSGPKARSTRASKKNKGSSQDNDTTKEQASSALPTKKSPKRKTITQIKVTSSKQLFKPRYVLYILDTLGFARLIFAEREGQPGNDAFLNPVHKAIGEETNPFRQWGLIIVCHRRVSQENNMPKTNINNEYPRKFIVGTYDEQTAGHQNRLIVLRAVQDFMMRSENNKFGHEYIVDEVTSDLTPANGQLEVVDNYLLDNAIVHFIHAIYEDVSPAWYSQNLELALEYFTPPNFPTGAVAGLGYPVSFNVGGEDGGEQDDDGDNEEETTNN